MATSRWCCDATAPSSKSVVFLRGVRRLASRVFWTWTLAPLVLDLRSRRRKKAAGELICFHSRLAGNVANAPAVREDTLETASFLSESLFVKEQTPARTRWCQLSRRYQIRTWLSRTSIKLESQRAQKQSHARTRTSQWDAPDWEQTKRYGEGSKCFGRSCQSFVWQNCVPKASRHIRSHWLLARDTQKMGYSHMST